MRIKLDHKAKTPLYRQISDQIKEMIDNGTVPSGYVMPSERSLAESLGVHRNTIISVYTELKSENYIVSQQRKNYIVNGVEEETADALENGEQFSWNGRMKGAYMSRSSKDRYIPYFNVKHQISFVGEDGLEAYCTADISSLLHELADLDDERKFAYSHKQGDYALRKTLSAFMRKKEVSVKPGNVLVVSETIQALNLLCEVMLQAGDTVIVEEPSHPGIYKVFQNRGIKIMTVGMDREGVLCDNLERLIVKYKPKLIYVNPDFHNPTGIVMSLERRKRVLSLAYQYGVPLVEEDELSELRFEGKPVPSLKSLDQHNNVIYLYSFSLTYAAGIKLAFVVADHSLVKKLGEILGWQVGCIDSISQWLLSQYLQTGMYARTIERIRKDHKKKCDLILSTLEEAVPWGLQAHMPEGGRSIWCKLAPEIDVKVIYEMARARGVLFLPGETCFFDPKKGKPYLRLAYDQLSEDEIREGIDVLVDVMREYRESGKL